jgi:hypothetical protein
LEYYSTDEAGNSEVVSNVTINIDSEKPSTVSIIDGQRGYNNWYISNISVNLTGTDMTSGVASSKYRLDGNEWMLNLGDIKLNTEGTHLIEFQSTDHAGNTEPLQVLSIKLDRTPPSSWTNVYGKMGENGWYTSNVNIELDSVDELSGPGEIRYSLNLGAWKEYSGEILTLGEGANILEYYSIDLAGNPELLNTLIIKIDKNGPVFNITDPIDGYKSETTNVTIEWMALDGPSGIEYFIIFLDNGSKYTVKGNTSFTFFNLTDGHYIVNLLAVDLAGNSNLVTTNFTVNSTKPSSPEEPFNDSEKLEETADFFSVMILIIVVILIIILFLSLLIKHDKIRNLDFNFSRSQPPKKPISVTPVQPIIPESPPRAQPVVAKPQSSDQILIAQPVFPHSIQSSEPLLNEVEDVS